MHNLFSYPVTGSLTLLDCAIVAASIAFLFAIAYVAGRKETDTGDFFLGKRRIPALIVCLSFVATEVSAVTLTGVPATGYSENWQYLQFFVGSASARVFVAFLFIPVFYHHNCTSIYEFLRDRFNAQTQYAGSVFFFITRLIGSGVRLYAACLAISVIMHCSLASALVVFTLVSIAFITFGGIKAVVWAGAYISLIFFSAGLSIIIYLLSTIPRPVAEAWTIAENAGRLSVFNFDFALNNPTTFWAGTANAFFICLAVFGTDQELVQRLLTVKTRKSSQKAVIATTFASLPLLCIYLAMGTLLFVFYQSAIAQPDHPKTVVSHFVVNFLPAGLKGLFLTAVVMASVDLPLASLSSSFVYDIYRPLINRGGSEKHYLAVSRFGVIGFGVILATIAFACQPVQSVLWFAFKVVSVTGGATLGIFLFGILVKNPTRTGKYICAAAIAAMIPACVFSGEQVSSESFWLRYGLTAVCAAVMIAAFAKLSIRIPALSNTFAMVLSSLAMALVLIFSQPFFGDEHNKALLGLAWSWLIVVGTLLTFSLAYLFSGQGISDKEVQNARHQALLQV